jgi:hypothetical protein
MIMKLMNYTANLSDRLKTPLVMLVFMFAAFLLSCDIPVEYHNPFDLNVRISPPSGLRIDSVNETSISLSWRNNFSVSGQDQMSHIQTVVSYSRRDWNGYSISSQVFYPIDTIMGLTSSATISRIFELIPGGGSAFFCVQTLAGSNSSYPSNFVGTTISSPTPSQLTATLINRTTCRLQWQDNSNSESYFGIERKISAADSFTLITKSPAHSSSFVDTTISYEGDTIYYRLCAVFENGLSSPYTTASLYVPLAAPAGLITSSINNRSVHMTWRNTVQFGDGFIIERAEKNGSFIEIGRVPATLNSYTDEFPDTTKEYIYRVKLYAGIKISDPSNSVDLGFWPIPKYVREISGNYGTMAASPDYTLIALTGNNGGDITVVNSADLQVLAQFHDANLSVQSVDIDVSNDYLAAGYVDNTQNTGKIKIWRLSDGSLYKEWNRSNPVSAVRFSPDGSLLAADGYSGAAITDPIFGNYPGSMSMIDIQKDTVIYTFSADHNIAFSPNQSLVAATTGGEFLAWSIANGSIQLGFNYDFFEGNSNINANAKGLKFLDDGTRIVLSTDDRVIVWDVNQKYSPLHVLANIAPIGCFDITPDDKFLVVSTDSRDWVVRADGFICASSTYLSRGFHSVLCLPNNRLIKAGTDGLKEYYLQKQWTSSIPSY